jgi:hypothetical protein
VTVLARNNFHEPGIQIAIPLIAATLRQRVRSTSMKEPYPSISPVNGTYEAGIFIICDFLFVILDLEPSARSLHPESQIANKKSQISNLSMRLGQLLVSVAVVFAIVLLMRNRLR